MCECTCIHICIYIYTYVHVYICSYTYAHISHSICVCIRHRVPWHEVECLQSPAIFQVSPWLAFEGLGPQVPKLPQIIAFHLFRPVFNRFLIPRDCAQRPQKSTEGHPKVYKLDTIFDCFGGTGGNVKPMVSCQRNCRLEGRRGSRETSCAGLCAQCFSTCFSERLSFDSLLIWVPKGVPGEDPRRSYETGKNVKTIVLLTQNHKFQG